MLVLSESMKRFSAEMRKDGLKVDGLITIGDVSQPGCGQLAHGVLVQEVSGKAGDELLAKAEASLVPRIGRARHDALRADIAGIEAAPAARRIVETLLSPLA